MREHNTRLFLLTQIWKTQYFPPSLVQNYKCFPTISIKQQSNWNNDFLPSNKKMLVLFSAMISFPESWRYDYELIMQWKDSCIIWTMFFSGANRTLFYTLLRHILFFPFNYWSKSSRALKIVSLDLTCFEQVFMTLWPF